MKKYYIHDGQNQQGPLSLEDVLKSGISRDTNIWHEGLDNWTPAQNLEEFKLIFEQKSPPPFEKAPPPPIAEVPLPSSGGSPLPLSYTNQKRSGVGFRRVIFFILILLGASIAVILYNNRNANSRYAASRIEYKESKMSVADYERAHPSEFLDASGEYNLTLFGNKFKVHGIVTNKATVANYKDIVIEVSYYSSTNTLISKERFIFYEFVPAHSKKSFEWKIKPPGGTSTIGWDAIGGIPY